MTCPHCEGTGQTRKLYTTEVIACPFCSDCKTCKGLGKVRKLYTNDLTPCPDCQQPV